MVYLGSIAQMLALASGAFSIFASLRGNRKRDTQLILLGKRAAHLHFYLLLICVLSLLYLLALPDLSVTYVTQHVNLQLPMFYRLTSIWAGQAGSMLWWNFLMVLFSVIAIENVEKKEPSLLPHTISILMFASLFFTALCNFSADSDPFQLIAAGGVPLAQPNGKGLNPLLQHWAMIIHPPILYLGYVSFAIPFAIAMAALIRRRINLNWSGLIRKWSIFSWFFLGVGMLLGGKWAYEELGWGGYWAWDPVENAALLPFITGTAFLHSILVQEKRGMLKVWNMVLVSLSFLMCIFGTFLTRSGVVSSVHAFASSDLGPLFAIFMGLIVLFSGYFILTRMAILRSDRPFNSFLSREAGFLYNNVILLISLFTVIWGTMYPTITEALFSERVSVTQVWFDEWMTPLGLIILFLTGMGPLLAWRRTAKEVLVRNFRLPLLALFGTCALYFGLRFRELYSDASTLDNIDIDDLKIWAGLTFGVAAFVITGVLEELFKVTRNRTHYTKEPFLIGFILAVLQNKRRYVGYLVHVSLAVLFIGFAGKSFGQETRLTLRQGEAEEFQGYLFHVSDFKALQYKSNDDTSAPLYFTRKVNIQIFQDNELLGEDSTEIRSYPMYSLQTQKYDDHQTTSEPAIIPHFFDDIYVQFGGVHEEDNRLILQVWVNPLVRVVWIGFYFFIFSGLILLLPIGEGKTIRVKNKVFNVQPQVYE